MLVLVDLTRENLSDFMRLKVREDQPNMVAPNPVSIAQSAYEPAASIWGLAAEGVPVGLMSMIDLEAPGAEKEPGDPDNAAYLWRLMIGAEHQGNGYGRAAIAAAFDVARAWGRAVLAVHSAEVPGNARPLYETMGFIATDRIDGGERLFLAEVPRA